MVAVVSTIAEVRAALDEQRRQGRSVGFVPTMGYLHDGHRSLMARAVAGNDASVVSIFVNPLQFGANEDLDRYPRNLDGDVEMARGEGIDLVFAPTAREMYPTPIRTTVTVADVSAGFEGASRPTHFAGVATVVAKLFSIVGPCRAYFGEKDFQQIAVVRTMTADLSLPVEIVACPTVREADGLAMSSRNVNLTPEARRAAPVLHRALGAGRDAIGAGERDGARVRAAMRAVVATEPIVELDYAEVVDALTLAPLARLDGELRLLIAARLPHARLIDNVGANA